jgi:hypothetical protein
MAADTDQHTIVYRGMRRATDVQVTREEHQESGESDHAPRTGCDLCPLPPRLDLACHSATGFEWGYQGSGPAQLALALLADAVGDEKALLWYPVFKRLVIARLPPARWQMGGKQIRRMVQLFEGGDPKDEPARAAHAAPQP